MVPWRTSAAVAVVVLSFLAPAAAAAWTTSTIATLQQWNGWDIALGDGDRDGKAEVYVPAHGIQRVKWTGSAWATTLVGNATSAEFLSVAVGDGDRNGNQEVYAGDDQGRVWKFSWDAATSKWIRQIVRTIGAPGDEVISITVGDAEHDGLFEVYAISRTPTPNGPNPPPIPPGHVFKLWFKDGVWNKKDLGATNTIYPRALWIGDGDRDGKREIYFCDSSAPTRLKLASGVWKYTAIGGQDGCDSIAIGDIDANGLQEVYAIGSFDEVIRYIKNSTGTGWARSVVGHTNESLIDLTIADLNNDGKSEGYVLSFGNGHLYRLRRAATWVLDDLGGAGTYGLAIAAGDGDGNGNREVYTQQVIVPGSHDGVVKWQPG